MPSYDVRGGKLVGAPSIYQKSWDDFNATKAPMSSAKDYRAEAEAENSKEAGKDKKKR